jgi:HEPN domain-containing protein
MHVPRAERAARWAALAHRDREAAARLAADVSHVACFLAQQASEKALKALLTALQGDAIPTHHAHVLLAALGDLREQVPRAVTTAANALDRYYVPTRYPDALDFADASVVYGADDAAQALGWADTVLAWADERVAAVRGEER